MTTTVWTNNDTGTVRGGVRTGPTARGKLGTDQTSIADATDTAVALDTEVRDTEGNMFDSGPGIVLVEKGVYIVVGSIEIDNSNIQAGSSLFLTGAGSNKAAVDTKGVFQVVEIVRTTAASQALGLSVNLDVSSGTSTLISGNNFTFLEATLVSVL